MSFKCILDKCPQHNNLPQGCHLWWEIPWENNDSGEVQVRKGCILSMEMGLPIVQCIVKAAHTASEHSSVARNAFENGVKNIQASIEYAVQNLPSRELKKVNGILDEVNQENSITLESKPVKLLAEN